MAFNDIHPNIARAGFKNPILPPFEQYARDRRRTLRSAEYMGFSFDKRDNLGINRTFWSSGCCNTTLTGRIV